MRLCVLLFALALFCPGLAAHADTIQTYLVSGTTASDVPGVGGAMSGTLAIDFTDLSATAANLTWQSNTVPTPPSGPYLGPYTVTWDGPVVFLEGRMSGPNFKLSYFVFEDSAGDELFLDLGITDPAPTYTGGPICTVNNLCSFGPAEAYSQASFPTNEGTATEDFTAGTATLITTPEPPSLILLALGLLGLCCAARLHFGHRVLG